MYIFNQSTRYVTGVVYVDRLPVLLLSLVDCTTKLLGVPKLASGLGRVRHSRDDYLEFLLLAAQIVGLQVDVAIRKPGSLHRERWMSLFSWRLTADAPVNDILLIQRLHDYDDAVLGSTGLKMMLHHSWYMSPESATLALFSSLLSDKEKTDLVHTIQAD
ncbi:hypothetical protein HELRODRAFT_162787 [Helobdella robusta]|uniref:Uncharacterized protein n=1 Tax=Helobdella robusta TaxID=6412 RepID=T1ET54_HELRO|nr:hypothetical protein HELRODRAFT_162787 [Helobdella robusta]ESN99269.1 hypothetical protein HELRODRAFT_162787 [Helobdella robusta]